MFDVGHHMFVVFFRRPAVGLNRTSAAALPVCRMWRTVKSYDNLEGT